jgi:hypothetical protein
MDDETIDAGLFDDWQIPTDDQWETFTLPDDPEQHEELVERMSRRLVHLRAEIAAGERSRDREVARIAAIAEDRLHGARRAERWITSVLEQAHRAAVEVSRYVPRTWKLFSGVEVRANATGGRPVIEDRAAYGKWATERDLIDRDATVGGVPWETLLLAVGALRSAIEEDIGGRSDGAPGLIGKIADDLDAIVEAQTKYRIPSFAEKGGAMRWIGQCWIDVETGEQIPGLGRSPQGWNLVTVVDQ